MNIDDNEIIQAFLNVILPLLVTIKTNQCLVELHCCQEINRFIEVCYVMMSNMSQCERKLLIFYFNFINFKLRGYLMVAKSLIW